MNATSITTLPHRLRETSFREYEDTIAQIVQSFPVVVKCNTGIKSPATFSARLRDAMFSLMTNRWETSKIDFLSFERNYLETIVSHRANGVFAGSREELKKLDELVQKSLTTEQVRLFENIEPEVLPLELNNLTRDELKFLCLLASNRALNRPISIKAAWFDLENKEWFESNFDISLEEKSNEESTTAGIEYTKSYILT